MTAEIIPFPNVPRAAPPATGAPELTREPHFPMYELYWMGSDGHDAMISTRDPDRIIRQMEHLARRGAWCTCYADGFPCGGVGFDRAGTPSFSFVPARA